MKLTAKLGQVLLTCLFFISIGSSKIILAEEDNSSNSENKPTLEEEKKERSFFSALRLSISDGVIKFVKDHKKASFDLSYNYIPITDDLTTQVGKSYNEENIFSLEIPNAALGNPQELKKYIPDTKEREEIAKALHLCKYDENATACLNKFEQNEFDLKTADENFDAYIKDVLLGDLKSSIRPFDYLTNQRDRNLMTALLGCPGMTASVNIPKAKTKPESPLFFDNLIWKIKVYKITSFPTTVVANPDSAATNSDSAALTKEATVALYRFTAEAEVPRFDIVFENNEQQVKLKPKFTFKDCSYYAGIRPTALSTISELDVGAETFESTVDQLITAGLAENEEAAEKILQDILDEAKNDNRKENQLETVLRFATGSSLSNVVYEGLFSGTSDASPILGAMVGGSEIFPIAGVNLELWDANSVNGGLLFGVALDRDEENSREIFLGPSFQYSIFTIAGGTRVFEEDNSIKFGAAGTISADLSQVIGSKRKVNEKELNNSIVGGGLGDLLSINPQDVDGMIWSFNLPTELNNASNIYFDLVKVQTQANGDPMITEKGELIPEPVRLRFRPSTSNQIKFLTPGCYFYQNINIPNEYNLLANGGDIQDSRKLPNDNRIKYEDSNSNGKYDKGEKVDIKCAVSPAGNTTGFVESNWSLEKAQN